AMSLAASLVALLVASQTGGLFAPRPVRDSGLELHLGIADNLGHSLEWLLRVFGLLLPLGIAGFLLLRRPRPIYAFLAFGGLAVINGVSYKMSWDIVKFA